MHQRPLLASGTGFYNSSYKPSFHLVSLIQVTPSSLLLSLIYQRGLCIKIKSNFTKAVERPSVYATASIVTLCAPLAIAFWAWDQYQFCRTSSRIRLSDYCRPAPSANTLFRLVFRTVAPQDVLNNIIEDVVCRAIGIHYQSNLLANLAIITSCTPDFTTLINDIQNSRTVFIVRCADSTAENVSARRVNRERLNQTGICRHERRRAYAQTEDGRQQQRNRQCF